MDFFTTKVHSDRLPGVWHNLAKLLGFSLRGDLFWVAAIRPHLLLAPADQFVLRIGHTAAVHVRWEWLVHHTNLGSSRSRAGHTLMHEEVAFMLSQAGGNQQQQQQKDAPAHLRRKFEVENSKPIS